MNDNTMPVQKAPDSPEMNSASNEEAVKLPKNFRMEHFRVNKQNNQLEYIPRLRTKKHRGVARGAFGKQS